MFCCGDACPCFVLLQLSVPDKVLIPERYVESDPEEVLSPEQEADKQRKVDRIKALIVKNRYIHTRAAVCSLCWLEFISQGGTSS